jgi:hypothetical protein
MRTEPKDVVGLIPPPHLTVAAKAAFDKAMAEGDLVYAKALCSSRNRMYSAEEAHVEGLGNLLQKRGGVMEVGGPYHRSAAAALDEVEFKTRA